MFMVLAGCSEEWLEIEPQNELTSAQFYRNEADAIASTTSAYDPLHSVGLYALDYQFVFYSHDDRVLIEFPLWNDLMFKSSEQSRIFPMYEYLFRGVYRTNMVLENVPGIEMDESLKQRLLAEAKFLRAFYYFNLRIFFNEPPLVLRVIKVVEESKLPNNSAAEIWAQIEADLLDAIAVLPETYDPANTGRATKGAALAMLGKTYLYQQKWEKATETLGRVMDAGVYQLSMPAGTDSIDYVNAYLSNFTPQAMPASDGGVYKAENNSESIFEIQNSDKERGWNVYIGGYGTNGTLLSAYFSIIGWRNIAPTAAFVDQFEEAPVDHPAGLKYDPRRYATVYAEGDTIETREGLDHYNELFNPTKHVNLIISQGYQVRKYLYPLHSENENSPYVDPNNWRYLRYADVLLMYAEAEYHAHGSTPVALAAINQVRERAGMSPVTEVTPEVIIHERDVEFGLECTRFHDLVRWSLLPSPWVQPADMVSGYVVGKNEYLPIPLSEITKMEGLLKQNPGW